VVNYHISDHDLDDRTRLISLGGELDLYTAPRFEDALRQALDAGKRRIVIDLSEATFIDSTTLAVIVAGSKRLSAAGGELALVCSHRAVMRVFEITGYDRLFSICASRDEAVRALADAPSG